MKLIIKTVHLLLRSKEDLPLWSYYLKTLIVQMVIDKPDKEFWSLPNLFYAFRDCLLKLNNAVLSTNLCDTFDYRLKLLTVLPKSLKRCHEESSRQNYTSQVV